MECYSKESSLKWNRCSEQIKTGSDNGMLLKRIQPEMEQMLRTNQNGFRKSRSAVSQILTVRRIMKGVKAKHLPATLLFVDFGKAFDSVHRENMKHILLSYGIPEETVLAIIMLYKKIRAMVRSPDSDTDFFQSWCTTKRHISSISICDLPRLRSETLYRSIQEVWSNINSSKRQAISNKDDH